MFRCKQGISFITLLTGLLWTVCVLVGCGSGDSGLNTDQAANETPTVTQQDLSSALPLPSALPRTTSYTSSDRIMLGAEFDHALPTNMVMENGNYAGFMPHYAPETSPLFNGTAYAMYRFPLAGYSDETTLYYRWLRPLDLYEANSHWIALSDWSTDRWEWFACDETGMIELDSLDPYIRPGGGYIVAVALVYRGADTGEGVTLNGLSYLRFGERIGRWVNEVAVPDASAWMVSLALSDVCIPNVAYMNGSLVDSDLYYASLSAVGWMATDLATDGNTGWYPCISTYIDEHDIESPLICYRNNTDNTLLRHYAYTRITVMGEPSLEWAQNDTGIADAWCGNYCQNNTYQGLSYFDSVSGHLVYSYHNGLSWVPYTVDDTGTTGEANCLLLDNDGHACIVYTNSDTDSIHYAHHTGSSWQLSVVEDSASELGNPHLALAPDGTPHVSYHNYTHDQTAWAWYDGTDWHKEVVYDLEAHGDSNDVVVDSSGVPHIAAVDTDHMNLMHFWRDPESGDWLGSLLESGAGHNPCIFLDMKIDYMDRIYIAYSGYYDGEDKALKFCYQVD